MTSHSILGRAALLLALASPAVAQTANPTVILSELVTSPTSVVSGARDAAGAPVATTFAALDELALRPDGGDWIVKARTSQAGTIDGILLRGGVAAPAVFAQETQPVQGGVAGELYDFFDTPRPAAWNSAGDMVYGVRAKGGVASVFEKIVVFDGVTHTIAAQMGDIVLGSVDSPTAPVGTQSDQTIGNSANSMYLLDDGTVCFGVTPLGNCHTSRYPVLVRGHTSFRQNGVSIVGTQTLKNIITDACGGTPDGLHYFAKANLDDATLLGVRVFIVDDVVIAKVGVTIAPGMATFGDTIFARMLTNGDWYMRGDDVNHDDFAMRNNVVLAKTGDPVPGGLPGENWGTGLSGFAGNVAGHWLLTGNTTNPNVNEDNVLVYDGARVLLREGQPIDVDGNALFDDDAFINSFQPDDLFLSTSNRVFMLVTLRNAALAGIGDAMLEFDVETPPTSFCSGDGSLTDHTTPCPCGNNGLPGNGCGHSFDPNGANLSATGFASTDNVVLHSQFEPSSSFTLMMQHANTGDTVFHDGVLCAANPLIRLRGRGAVGGEAFFPNSLFAQDSTTTLSQRGGVTVGSGAVRFYAAWYRNASTTFCPPATANVTNGIRVTW